MPFLQRAHDGSALWRGGTVAEPRPRFLPRLFARIFGSPVGRPRRELSRRRAAPPRRDPCRRTSLRSTQSLGRALLSRGRFRIPQAASGASRVVPAELCVNDRRPRDRYLPDTRALQVRDGAADHLVDNQPNKAESSLRRCRRLRYWVFSRWQPQFEAWIRS